MIIAVCCGRDKKQTLRESFPGVSEHRFPSVRSFLVTFHIGQGVPSGQKLNKLWWLYLCSSINLDSPHIIIDSALPYFGYLGVEFTNRAWNVLYCTQVHFTHFFVGHFLIQGKFDRCHTFFCFVPSFSHSLFPSFSSYFSTRETNPTLLGVSRRYKGGWKCRRCHVPTPRPFFLLSSSIVIFHFFYFLFAGIGYVALLSGGGPN